MTPTARADRPLSVLVPAVLVGVLGRFAEVLAPPGGPDGPGLPAAGEAAG